MASLPSKTNSKKTSSDVHKLMLEYATKPLVHFQKFEEGLVDIFSSPAKLKMLDAYIKLRDSFNNDETLDKRAEQAQKIADAAISIREIVPFWSNTILTDHRSAEISISNLSAQEVTSLTELYGVLLSKLKSGTKQAGKGVDMYANFITDLETFKEIGMMSNRWLKGSPPAVARVRAYCEQQKIDFPDLDAIPTPRGIDDAKFKQQIETLINASKAAMPQNQTTKAKTANVFMVDYWVALAAQIRLPYGRNHSVLSETTDHVIQVKQTDADGNESFVDNVIKLPKLQMDPKMVVAYFPMISKFTMSQHIGKNDLQKFINLLHPEIRPLFSKLGDENSLFMNPAKLTVSRLFGALSMNYKIGTVHAILCRPFNEDTFKVLAKIYDLEKPLDTSVGTSSDGEYLLHEILTLGMNGGFQYNKNKIPKSALSVTFKVSSA